MLMINLYAKNILQPHIDIFQILKFHLKDIDSSHFQPEKLMRWALKAEARGTST